MFEAPVGMMAAKLIADEAAHIWKYRFISRQPILHTKRIVSTLFTMVLVLNLKST